MKRATICLVWIALGLVWLGQGASPAYALKAFRDAFVAAYVKADSEEAKDKSFSAAVEKAKCNICHEGKIKKNRNDYGKALAELLKKTDEEDKEKILAALKKVEGKRIDPKDDQSPTFGQQIRAGKLPVEPKK